MKAPLCNDVHELEENSCPSCGGLNFIKARSVISEGLDYVPASFWVVRHIQHRMICKGCDAELKGKKPTPPIERGKQGAGFLADVLVSKYADHLPLNRQSEFYAREGVGLFRWTMADWVRRASTLLTQMIDVLRTHVFAAYRLEGDDMPVPVLEPGKGKTKIGRLWPYERDGQPYDDEAPAAGAYFFARTERANIRAGIGKTFGACSTPTVIAAPATSTNHAR